MATKNKDKVEENISEVGEEKVEKNEIKIENSNEKLLEENKQKDIIIKDLTEKNKQTENTLESLQKKMEEMQSAFIKMQSMSQSVNNASNNSRTIELGGRLISGTTIYSPNRDVEREIPYNRTIEVSETEMNMLLKTLKTKELLEDDVIYFVDKDNYEHFKIYNHFDLNDEKLVELLTKYDSTYVIQKLNEITKNKRSHALMHSIFYRIVDLTRNSKLNAMNYKVKQAVEEFYKFKIENAIMLLDNVENVM